MKILNIFCSFYFHKWKFYNCIKAPSMINFNYKYFLINIFSGYLSKYFWRLKSIVNRNYIKQHKIKSISISIWLFFNRSQCWAAWSKPSWWAWCSSSCPGPSSARRPSSSATTPWWPSATRSSVSSSGSGTSGTTTSS